ncbi:Protein of unknown function DUF1420 [Candidatus Pelagibacterales bacterium]
MLNSYFLSLSDITFHPLLILFLNVLMVFSIYFISFEIYKNFFKYKYNFLLDIICVNLLIYFFIIFFFQFIYLFNFHSLALGRILIIFLYLIGFLFFLKNIVLLKFFKRYLLNNYNIYILIPFVLYFLLSLSPPTDIDSTDYHLGAPLEWYRKGFFYPRIDWLHFRNTGLGEILNLFGLHFGSDNFGQLLQFLGLLIVLLSGSIFLNKEKKIFFSVLIFSTPLLLFLLSSQKYQMLSSSLLFFSIILLINSYKNFNLFYLFTSILIFLFSTSNKINYVIPVCLISLVWIYIIYRKNKYLLLKFFFVFLFLFSIFLFPHYYINYLFYGDPVSPILESFKSNPDPIILDFIKSEKNFDYLPESSFFYNFSKLFFTLNIGDISRVIGFGFFPILFLKYNLLSKTNKILLIFIIITFFTYAITFLGIGRYYLDIYFINSFLIASIMHQIKFIKAMKIVLFAQLFFVTIFLLYAMISLFPGSLTKNINHSVKIKTSEGYALSVELDKLLPKDSKILVFNYRSYSYLPRDFISGQYFNFLKTEEFSNELKRNISINSISHIVSKKKNYEISCLDNSDIKVIEVNRASRNPFNSRSNQTYFIHRVKNPGKCYK